VTTDLAPRREKPCKNLKGPGRTLALVLGSVGKGVLKKSFVNSVRAIEARNNAAPGR
jgi:hypothetical protein